MYAAPYGSHSWGACFELHLPASQAANAYEALKAAGKQLERETGAPVRDGGYFAIDSLSAEKSYRHWHADLGAGDTPMEAGIGFTTTKAQAWR